jgi:diguanylate cyclase (GGDEF)-like protein
MPFPRVRNAVLIWAEQLVRFRGRTVLAIGLVALLVLAVASHQFARAGEEAVTRVRQIWNARTEIESVLSLCSEAETGVLDYLLTGRKESLNRYDRAEAALPQALSRLRQLSREEGWPAERVDHVEILARGMLAHVGRLGHSPNARGFMPPAHLDPGLLERSRATMDALRGELQAMEVEETRRLEERQRVQRRLSWGFSLVIAAAVAVGLLAKVLAALLWASLKSANAALRAQVDERGRAQEALKSAKAELEARVETRTAEITAANRTLEQELAERKRIEEQLQKANAELASGLVELQRHNQAATELSQMVDLLQSCLTVEEAALVVSRSLPRLFPGASGSLSLLRPSRNLAETVAAWGDLGSGSRVFSPEDCWALRRGQIHAVSGSDSSLVCRHVGTASPPLVCVPMTAQGEMFGVLHLRSGSLRPERPDQHGILLTTGDDIALAFANLRLRETLRDQSIRDPLTGLYNRRYMEESLEREVRRAARGQHSLGIVMMDLDHFKEFNDAYGHAAGDALLRELGGLFRSFVRAEDIACRYGGEEFTLILPEATLEGARQRAERLREGVRQLHVKPPLEGFSVVTLSLGVAAFPDHGTSGDALLRLADTALYRAKAEGRDRTCVAPLPHRLKAVVARTVPVAARTAQPRRFHH